MKDELEIMRVWRIPPLGKLVIEVNGQRYKQLADIRDPKLKQRLLAAIGEMISFAGEYQTLVDAGVSPPLTPSQPQKSEESDPETLTPEQAEFLARLEAERDELATRKPTRGRARLSKEPEPLVVFTETGDVKPAESPSGPKSIAEQIDAILQKQLATQPELTGRSINLEQNPNGGLRINVDGAYYDKPADIPDRQVQLAIKMAVKAWNSA
jgi:hypothetical protein